MVFCRCMGRYIFDWSPCVLRWPNICPTIGHCSSNSDTNCTRCPYDYYIPTSNDDRKSSCTTLSVGVLNCISHSVCHSIDRSCRIHHPCIYYQPNFHQTPNILATNSIRCCTICTNNPSIHMNRRTHHRPQSNICVEISARSVDVLNPFVLICTPILGAAQHPL